MRLISKFIGPIGLLVLVNVSIALACLEKENAWQLEFPAQLRMRSGLSVKEWRKEVSNIDFGPYLGFAASLENSYFDRVTFVLEDLDNAWSEKADDEEIVSVLWFTKECLDCTFGSIEERMNRSGYSFIESKDFEKPRSLNAGIHKFDYFAYPCSISGITVY